MRDLARSNGISLSEARRAGLIKPVKNTKAGSMPPTPGLSIIYSNTGEAPVTTTVKFKRQRVNEGGNRVPRLV